MKKADVSENEEIIIIDIDDFTKKEDLVIDYDDLLERGVALEDIAAKYDKEVANIEGYRKEGREEGLAEGFQKGLAQGKTVGIREGIRQGKREGVEEGLKKGICIGAAGNTRVIVCNMKKSGLEPKVIAQYTGLKLNYVEYLYNKKEFDEV